MTPDPHERVDRQLSWLAFIGETAAVISAGLKLSSGGSESYLPGWSWIMFAALAAICAASLVEMLLRSTTRGSTIAYVVVALVVAVAHLWLWDPTQAHAIPAFDNSIAVGMGLAFLVFPRLLAIAMAAAIQVLYVTVLPRAVGGIGTAWIVVTTSTAALLCLVARGLIDESIAQMRISEELSFEVESLEDQTAARTRALNNWLDIVHRVVIGTLLPASREPGADAGLIRERAIAAVDALSAYRLPESDDSFSRFVQKAAKLQNLDVVIDQQGEWNAEGPQTALKSSVTEALSNVQRHAGVGAASISARFLPSEWLVTIADRGRGFSPADVAMP